MPIANKVNEFINSASWIRKMFEQGAALRQQYGADQVFDVSEVSRLLYSMGRRCLIYVECSSGARQKSA